MFYRDFGAQLDADLLDIRRRLDKLEQGTPPPPPPPPPPAPGDSRAPLWAAAIDHEHPDWDYTFGPGRIDASKVSVTTVHFETLLHVRRLRAANPKMRLILYWPFGGGGSANYADPAVQDDMIARLNAEIRVYNLDGMHWDGPPQPGADATLASQLVRLGDGLSRMLGGKIFDTESVGQDWFPWSVDGSEDYWRRWNTSQTFVVGIPTEGEKCAFAFRCWNKLHALGKGMNPIPFGGDAQTQPIYMPFWYALYMIMQDGPHDWIGSQNFPEFERIVKAQPWADPAVVGQQLGTYKQTGSVLVREYDGVSFRIDLDRPYDGAQIRLK